MKLSKWCEKQGIHYNTGVKWFHEGRIPNARQMDTGTILIDEEIKNNNKNNVIYCRVSNQLKKEELNYQIERCEQFCLAKGIEINKIYKEVASGMNDNRKELWKMLDLNPSCIIIENKDRLTRFGFNYIEKLLNKLGCEVIVINRDKESETDLIKDLVSIITSFCCRLYGLHKGNNKIKKIKEIINEE